MQRHGRRAIFALRSSSPSPKRRGELAVRPLVTDLRRSGIAARNLLQPRLGGRLKVLPKLFRANEAGADTFAPAPNQRAHPKDLAAVKARPKTRHRPTRRPPGERLSETSTIRHSIHGASGAGIRNPCWYKSTRTCLRRGPSKSHHDYLSPGEKLQLPMTRKDQLEQVRWKRCFIGFS